MTGKPSASSLFKLYVSQFLSAFVDNAFFYVILGILEDKGIAKPADHLVLAQTLFVISYIVLAPFVGTFAEKWSKSRVLLIGNGMKALGIALMFTGLPAAWCYMLVGVGAVIYSPAKYGILMELTTSSKQLLIANGRMEGFTIAAIIAGTVGGGYITLLPGTGLELTLCILLYALSMGIAYYLPHGPTQPSLRYGTDAIQFFRDIALLMRRSALRYTLIGTAGFWMIAVLLRIALIEWLAVHLPELTEEQRPLVFGVTTIGIVIGALVAPALFQIKKFYHSVWIGVGLVVAVIASTFAPNIVVLVPLLLVIGVFGGVYIVPMNAALQDIASPLIGSGKVVAIQNVFENVFMLLSMGFLALRASNVISLSIDAVMITGAIALLLIIVYLLLLEQANTKKELSTYVERETSS